MIGEPLLLGILAVTGVFLFVLHRLRGSASGPAPDNGQAGGGGSNAAIMSADNCNDSGDGGGGGGGGGD